MCIKGLSQQKQLLLSKCLHILYSNEYNDMMKTIKYTPDFDKWFGSIRDGMTKRRLVRRLEKVQLGNLGDVKPVGEGVWEMREFFVSGWRMYYIEQGDVIIVMLGGGDKSTQQSDITKAIALSKQLEE